MHFVADGGDPLVEDAEQVAEDHPRTMRRHHPEADLVGHHHRVGCRGDGVAQRIDSRVDRRLHVLVRGIPQRPVVQHGRQPCAETVDENLSASPGHGGGDI